MSKRKSNLPTISSSVANDLRMWTDRVREIIEGKDGFVVSRDDLEGAGVITVDNGGNVGPPNNGSNDDSVIIPIFTPPKPEFLIAEGGWQYINLEWKQPSYYGHQSTQVYRAQGEVPLDAPVEEDLVFIHGQGDHASVWSDNVGVGQTFTYFVRFTNLLGEKGPFSEGATASTAIDVDEALDALSGQISTSELATDLRALTDGLEDNYVVKVGKGGVASGFGIATKEDSTTGKVESTFAILADSFALLPPVRFDQPTAPSNSVAQNGDLWRKEVTDNVGNVTDVYSLRVSDSWVDFDAIPFIVRTTPTTIDGVAIPAGVYIRDAYIADGSIARAKIGKAAIDNARIANAAITRAKIATLDAASIISGELKSYNFSNDAGKAGFFLGLGSGQSETEDGTLYPQEDVSFILRSKELTFPALQLVDEVVTISGLVIRDFLQSITFNDPASAGFQFDIQNGTFKIKNSSGQTILASGGSEGVEDPNFILNIIDNKIKELEGEDKANATAAGNADNKAGNAQGTANSALSQTQATAQSLNNTFTKVGGEYTFKNNFTDFFTSDNDLKDFAFLSKITPTNVSTYIANASIKQATIAALAVGRAQIRNLAVSTAQIGNAAVQTLQIGSNAVVVSQAYGGSGGTSNSNNKLVVSGSLNPRGGKVFATVSMACSARDNYLVVSMLASSGGGVSARISANDNSQSGFATIDAPCSVTCVSDSSNKSVTVSVKVTGNGAKYSGVVLSLASYKR